MENRRTASGILVKPRAQIKQAFTVVVMGILYQMVLIGVLGYFSQKSFIIIARAYDIEPEAIAVVTNSIFSNVLIVLALGVMLGILAIFIWVRVNHRFFGPMVPISRHVEELCKGNFNSRVNLRKGDEWQELSADLNRLAIKLQERQQ